jgi:hypothetical protein
MRRAGSGAGHEEGRHIPTAAISCDGRGGSPHVTAVVGCTFRINYTTARGAYATANIYRNEEEVMSQLFRDDA